MEQALKKSWRWVAIIASGVALGIIAVIFIVNVVAHLPAAISTGLDSIDTVLDSRDTNIEDLLREQADRENRQKRQLFQSRYHYAQQGSPHAQYVLGLAYRDGEGVDPDHTDAIVWFRKAAEQGHLDAHNALGKAYAEGLGVEQDLVEAISWYQKSAEQGNQEAQDYLDRNSALIKWSAPAQQGDAEAQYNLGFAYDTGDGARGNTYEAVRWYRESAGQGNVDAQNNLVRVYKRLGGKFSGLLELAEQGNVDAILAVGESYAKGLGITQDHSKAFEWFFKVAEQGNADAQFAIGKAYKDGLGTTQDVLEAISWYQKSAEQGNEDAQNYLSRHSTFVESYAPAQQGDAEAQVTVGLAYENGRFVKWDIVEALAWYNKAAKQGNVEATEHIARICFYANYEGCR